MKLRFVWHIFRKDTRRLWWMIALTLALLARLAHQDSWRNVATPGAEEGWLNILLPLAWSFLIALAILEDPAVGEAPFWATIPCRWPSLLTAKAAFVAAFIHIPYFVACAFIVNARGFAPMDYLAVLFGKQLTLLALTLPAIALATLVGSVTRFMIVAIALAAAIAAPSFPSAQMDSPATHGLREIVLLSFACIAALWVAIVQYGRYRAEALRLGITVIWIAATIWWSPRQKIDALQAMLSPASKAIGQPSIHLPGPNEAHDPREGFDLGGASGSMRAAIPLTVSGFAPGYSAHFIQSGVRVETSAGRSFPASGTLHEFPSDIPTWQLLTLDKKIFDQIKDSPANVDGAASATYYRQPEPVWTSVDKHITVAGLGKCSTEIVGDTPNDEQLRVGCESPHQMPVVRVRLLDPATNRDWKETLGSSTMVLDYPTATWLSPVQRRATYIPITDEEHPTQNLLRWQVPREVILDVGIAITPEFPAGRGVVHYQLPDLKLSQYGVTP